MKGHGPHSELEWLGEILWGRACASPHSRYAVLPSASRPRLLVPLESPRAGAYVLGSYSTSSLRSRLGSRVLAGAFRMGLSRAVVRARAGPDIGDTDPALIENHLQELLSQPAVASVFFQTGRPQKKPVLQLITQAGAPVAFAKVGWNGLTRALVQTEAAALRDVAGALAGTAVTTPSVLHDGSWRGNALLVVSAITGQSTLPLAVFPEAATRALAGLASREAVPLASSPYWEAQLSRMERFGTRTLDAINELIQSAGGAPHRFGRIHGDWVPWNMTQLRDGGVAAWDWEWSRDDGPAGLDAMQWLFQSALHLRRLAPAAAVDDTIRSAASALPAIGLDPTAAYPLLAAHLAESVLRLLEADAQGVSRVIPTHRYDIAAERLSQMAA